MLNICTTASLKKWLAPIVLSVLTLLSSPASAGNIPAEEGPCGILHSMGSNTKIYNNSIYAWNVVFRTVAYSSGIRAVNAGAVKYLSDGMWIDNGTGDYHTNKIYTVPVGAGQTVKIGYCADKSMRDVFIQGEVVFNWDYTANSDFANNAHGTPDGFVVFQGLNVTPVFYNQGTTAYVNYNRNLSGAIENGSLTICPNDQECKIP